MRTKYFTVSIETGSIREDGTLDKEFQDPATWYIQDTEIGTARETVEMMQKTILDSVEATAFGWGDMLRDAKQGGNDKANRNR